MMVGRRYEVVFDGCGGILGVDRVRNAVRFRQTTGLTDSEMHYVGLRLLLPLIFDQEDGFDVVGDSVISVFKPLEKTYRKFIVILPTHVASTKKGSKGLCELTKLVRLMLGWDLLPICFDEKASVEVSVVAAAFINGDIAYLANSNPDKLGIDERITAAAKYPRFDDARKQELVQLAEREYASKDYRKKRRASFLEYYADRSFSEVLKQASYDDCQIINANQLEGELDDALVSRSPFSLIRLGEGEGCFLSYWKYLENQCPRNEVYGVCAKDIYRVWFDQSIHDVQREHLQRMRELFWQAIDAADIIGIPTAERVVFEYADFIRDITTNGYCRGYVGVSEILAHVDEARLSGRLAGKRFTDCDIARPLYEWQDWGRSLATILPRMLHGRRGVTLVTCHDQLAPTLSSMLNLENVRSVLIPPEKGRMKGDEYETGDHYQHYFQHITETLRREASPIVLVAAGFLGKSYCAVAKSAGSVAIDIGSLADYWVGTDTRKKNSWSIPSPFAVKSLARVGINP